MEDHKNLDSLISNEAEPAILVNEDIIEQEETAKQELKKLAKAKQTSAKAAANKGSKSGTSIAESSYPRKFIVNLKKESDEDLARFHDILNTLNDSPVGEVPFEDLVWYLVTEKLEQSDYRRIRELAFARKIEQARCAYNKEHKTDYSLLEFIAATTGELY